MHRIACAVLFSGVATAAMAGPRAGVIDPTFGTGGLVTHAFDLNEQGSDRARAFAEDDQGRLYVAGVVEDAGGNDCLGVVRFSRDGALDQKYAGGGHGCVELPFHLDGVGILVHDAVIIDGELVIAGVVPDSSAFGEAFVCRLDADGALDETFNSLHLPGCRGFPQLRALATGALGGIVAINVRLPTVRLVARGENLIIVINEWHDPGFSPAVVGLDSHGSPMFFAGAEVIRPFYVQQPGQIIASFGIAMRGNGRLVLVGAKNFNEVLIAQINLDEAQLDPQFGADGEWAGDIDAVATSVVALPSGNIRVGGLMDEGKPILFGITAEGDTDSQFNSGNKLIYYPCAFHLHGCAMAPTDLHIDAAGRIIMAGLATFDDESYDVWALRLSADGEPDANFGSQLATQEGFARVKFHTYDSNAIGLVLQGQRVVLGGTVANGEDEGNVDFALVRLADGSIFSDGLEATP